MKTASEKKQRNREIGQKHMQIYMVHFQETNKEGKQIPLYRTWFEMIVMVAIQAIGLITIKYEWLATSDSDGIFEPQKIWREYY